jgi:hypothetical protein
MSGNALRPSLEVAPIRFLGVSSLGYLECGVVFSFRGAADFRNLLGARVAPCFTCLYVAFEFINSLYHFHIRGKTVMHNEPPQKQGPLVVPKPFLIVSHIPTVHHGT